ncbi:MAG: type II toxin-antitoxin system prevent-host-death family antitoxin [Chloroflexi bacterium]|nr:type II toxin-antitoxin system prevent-host-death family antitoxin [Chloroflexota bacterium]
MSATFASSIIPCQRHRESCVTRDTLPFVTEAEVSVRDLRHHGGEVLDQVARGRPVTVTRDGKPVAILQPYVHACVSAETLLARWRHLPHMDPRAWRRDVGDLLDSRL